MRSIGGSLHVIVGGTNAKASVERLAEQAINGGADVIQLRNKTISTSELLSVAKRLRALTREHSVSFIVNDRVDVALAVLADGVHIGQHDLPLKEVRKLMGETAVIGQSCGSLEEARRAQDEGADYIGFGHMYPTDSKIKLTAPKTLEELHAVAGAVSIPVIAIGGIMLDNLNELLSSGADGIAVIGAVTNASDPEAATRALRENINQYYAPVILGTVVEESREYEQ